MGALSFLMIIFQRNDTQVLEKDIPAGGESLQEDWLTKDRESVCEGKLAGVNALSQGRSRAWSQEDACVKFSGAEGNVEVTLLSTPW